MQNFVLIGPLFKEKNDDCLKIFPFELNWMGLKSWDVEMLSPVGDPRLEGVEREIVPACDCQPELLQSTLFPFHRNIKGIYQGCSPRLTPLRPVKFTKPAGRSGAKLTADSIDTPFHYAQKWCLKGGKSRIIFSFFLVYIFWPFKSERR